MNKYPLRKKVCCCCGAIVWHRVRKCAKCGPAIWRPLNSVEFATEMAEIEQLRRTFESLKQIETA